METVRNVLEVMELGRGRYRPVWQLQEELVARRKVDDVADTLILVEHEPVFTLGRNADEANVTADADELQKRGIELVRTSRGGDVTYHGPGQVVGYPILDLRARNMGVVAYVGALEEVILRTLLEFGIKAETDRTNRGVWVGDCKIAALGVRVTRHVTMHGFALNVRTEPHSYDGIVPCGIVGKGVTSMHLLCRDVRVDHVKDILVSRFVDVFGYAEVTPVPPAPMPAEDAKEEQHG